MLGEEDMANWHKTSEQRQPHQEKLLPVKEHYPGSANQPVFLPSFDQCLRSLKPFSSPLKIIKGQNPKNAFNSSLGISATCQGYQSDFVTRSKIVFPGKRLNLKS